MSELTSIPLTIILSMLTYIVSWFWQTKRIAYQVLIFFLSISLVRNLLVPLCGRTGGGRVRACWFYMPSLSTPFRSATIINWQWFGRTSNAYRSQPWRNLLCFIPLHFLRLSGISFQFIYRTLSLCPDWFKALINYCILFGQWCFVLDKNHEIHRTAYFGCPYCSEIASLEPVTAKQNVFEITVNFIIHF